MEQTLRCNDLKCRGELNGYAVVTTCSHIFCIDCANRLQLSNPPGGQRPICPACDNHLDKPDDAIVTNLIPTEDYKTSILSGLSPDIIMECAGRALSFWAYQTAQEIVYQEYVAKDLSNRYTSLNIQMDKIIHDANAEISDLRAKMSDMAVDQDSLRRKNADLLREFRDKSRKHLQTQELYDKLKRRALLGNVQSAASDAVESTILASAASNRFMGHRADADLPQQQQQPQLFSNKDNVAEQFNFRGEDGTAAPMLPPATRIGYRQNWNDHIVPKGDYQNDPSLTPSIHRQRLAAGNFTGMGQASLPLGRTASAPLIQRRETLARQPLTNSKANSASNYAFAGYGMSAGVKVSHPQGVTQSPTGATRPTIRSRVAQRPGSASLIGNRAPAFGSTSGGNTFGQGAGYFGLHMTT